MSVPNEGVLLPFLKMYFPAFSHRNWTCFAFHNNHKKTHGGTVRPVLSSKFCDTPFYLGTWFIKQAKTQQSTVRKAIKLHFYLGDSIKIKQSQTICPPRDRDFFEHMKRQLTKFVRMLVNQLNYKRESHLCLLPQGSNSLAVCSRGSRFKDKGI